MPSLADPTAFSTPVSGSVAAFTPDKRKISKGSIRTRIAGSEGRTRVRVPPQDPLPGNEGARSSSDTSDEDEDDIPLRELPVCRNLLAPPPAVPVQSQGREANTQHATPRVQHSPQPLQRDSSPPVQTFHGPVSSDNYSRAPSEQPAPAPQSMGLDGRDWFPFSVMNVLHQARTVLNHPGSTSGDQSRQEWDIFASNMLTNVLEAYDNIRGEVPMGTSFHRTSTILADGAKNLLGLVPFEKQREDIMIEERFSRMHEEIRASHVALNTTVQVLAQGVANLGNHVQAQSTELRQALAQATLNAPTLARAPPQLAQPQPHQHEATPVPQQYQPEEHVEMDTRPETRPEPAQPPASAQPTTRQREKRPETTTPGRVPTPSLTSATPTPTTQAPPPPPKDSRYERSPTAPSIKSSAPPRATATPAPKLNKAQRAQQQNVPGSAASTEAKAKSYASAVTPPDQLDAAGWSEAKSRGKRPQQLAKKTASTPPKASLYTKYTIHFTHGKPKPASVTPSRCIKVWRAIHAVLSDNPVARTSGAALIRGLSLSRGGNLLAEWPAHVKASAVMAMSRVIERVVADDFGLHCQLESDEAWTRFVVENAPARDEDGEHPATDQLVAPIFESAIFENLPKQIMEGPRWLIKRDSAIPPFASFQVAVLDPEGVARIRFERFAFNGKVDVFYAGRKCKMRLFVQKEIFSQCTMCWRHGHSKGDSACKARKELCTRCGDAHRTQMHDQACVKCHGLNRKECECAPRCVNCMGAHRSDDVTCTGRLKYRDPRRVPTTGASDGFRGGTGGVRVPTAPAPDKAVPVNWDGEATQEAGSAPRGLSPDDWRVDPTTLFEGDPSKGWEDPVPAAGPSKRAPVVPSSPVEGVSASIHAPSNERKTTHVNIVSDSDPGTEDEDFPTPAAVAQSIAVKEKRRKNALMRAVEDAAPRPPDPDTRMGSSPVKSAPAKLPRARAKRVVLLTTGGGRIMGGPNDPHVVSSQETDPIMRARQQAFDALANSQEVEHSTPMQGVLERLNAGLSPPDAAAASQSSVPAPSSSYPVPHLDLSQFPLASNASTAYTPMPSSLVAALPSNPQL